MKRTVVIGGSGFVGTHLLRVMGDSPVYNIDKRDSLAFPGRTTILDIRNGGELRNELKDVDTVVLLAAEHKDDVTPISLYYDVNVQGTQNVLDAMDANGVKNIVFTSSVAVYGLNKPSPDEKHPADPFNHYGKSKWMAEEVLRHWHDKDRKGRSLTIIRPTVIFGEDNRGNVFKLLKQISTGRFMMIGRGENKKSMAYVENVVAFVKYLLEHKQPGYQLYNYVDKPDLSMNELVGQVGLSINRKISPLHLPYWCGLLGGFGFDMLAFILRRKFSISSVRIKKFCATTQFDAAKAHSNGFKRPFSVKQALERTLKYEFNS